MVPMHFAINGEMNFGLSIGFFYGVYCLWFAVVAFHAGNNEALGGYKFWLVAHADFPS